MNVNSDEYFMRIALEQAQIAFEKDEVPVGAVITYHDKVIAKGHNLCEKFQNQLWQKFLVNHGSKIIGQVP